MNIINVTEFRNNIGTYIDRLIYNNEEFLLKKGNKVVAKVSTYNEKNKSKKMTTFRDLAGLWDSETGEIEKMNKMIDAEDVKDLIVFDK